MRKHISGVNSCCLAIATSIATLGALPSSALAQAAEGEAVVDRDAIIVTARRRAENVQDVPIAITAVSAETLNNFRIVQTEDLGILEPSFKVNPSSGYVNKNVYGLRGIRPTESIYGQDPTVQIYLADVVQSPSQGSNQGFYDLQNVQILKGPQGTLFGRNTIGGAILLTPRRPGDTFAANAMVGVGNFGLFEAEAGVDIPLAPTFHVRLAGRTVDSDGYQRNVGPGPFAGEHYGGEKTRSLRATIVGDLSDNIQNTLLVTYDNRQTNGRIQRLEAINLDPAVPGSRLPILFNQATRGAYSAALVRAQGRDVQDVESNIPNYDDVEAWSITDTTSINMSEQLTLKSILNYRQVRSRNSIDLDSTIETLLHSTPQSAALDHHSAELQLQKDGDAFDWTIGGYYYNEKGFEYSPGIFFPQFLAINPIEQRGDVNNTSYAVFAQGSYKLTDKLTATVGARMNWDKKQLALSQRNAGNCAQFVLNEATANPNDTIRLANNACIVPLAKNFSSPTGSASLDYQITPNILSYVTSRLGYRSGGFNLRATAPGNYRPFNEETVIDLEGGIKSDYSLGDVMLRSNLAVYHQWYDDIQRTIQVADPLTGQPGSSVVNAAKATVFGIELQQMIRPASWLTFDFSYTYVKPRYKNFKEEVTQGNFVDVSSTPFPFTPRHSGSIRTTIEAPLKGEMGALRFSGNAAWQDDIWINSLHTQRIIDQHPASVRPLLKQKAYWLVDLSAGWDDIAGSGFSLSAYVRNVFDKEYKIGGIQLYTGASGFIAAAYGVPRTAGVQLRYAFD